MTRAPCACALFGLPFCSATSRHSRDFGCSCLRRIRNPRPGRIAAAPGRTHFRTARASPVARGRLAIHASISSGRPADGTRPDTDGQREPALAQLAIEAGAPEAHTSLDLAPRQQSINLSHAEIVPRVPLGNLCGISGPVLHTGPALHKRPGSHFSEDRIDGLWGPADFLGDLVNRLAFAFPAPHQHVHDGEYAPVAIFVLVVPRRFPTSRHRRRPDGEHTSGQAACAQTDAETTLELVPGPLLGEGPIRQVGNNHVVVIQLTRSKAGRRRAAAS